jgi:hypothetical protein
VLEHGSALLRAPRLRRELRTAAEFMFRLRGFRLPVRRLPRRHRHEPDLLERGVELSGRRDGHQKLRWLHR